MSESSRSSVAFQLSVILIGGAGLWALLAGPAWLLAGTIGVLGLTIAAVLCLTPALVSVAFDVLFSPSQSRFALSQALPPSLGPIPRPASVGKQAPRLII